jgi:hypothetical protein
MAINEQEFNDALADFVSTLDESLAAIQSKLDGMGVGSDFTEELDMLTNAKTKLTDFVAANSDSTENPDENPDETTEPPSEEQPVA